MNRLTWVMLVVACMLIGKGVLDSVPRTASSSMKSMSQGHPEAQKGRVIGIMQSPTKVSAMVGSRLVREGDMVGDVEVVKIEDGRVHFEKLGIKWSQTLHDPPSQHWK